MASVGTVGTAVTVATAASEVASTVALVDSEVLDEEAKALVHSTHYQCV